MSTKKNVEKEVSDNPDAIAKKDNFFNDVADELDVDIENEDAIDSMLDIVNSTNLDVISDIILNKYAVNLEVEQIERMIIDHDLDVTSERIDKDLYNLYMKHYQ